MSQSQLNRFSIISKVIDGNMTVALAAEALGISIRQVLRIKKGVINEGPSALIHKNKNRKPAHAIAPALSTKIIALKQSERYQNANFQHFKELLEVREKITISYSALYSLLTNASMQSPKKRRRFKPHRRRKRKAQDDLGIQILQAHQSERRQSEWINRQEQRLRGIQSLSQDCHYVNLNLAAGRNN